MAKISLCFEVEADEADIYFLKKSLKERPGAPTWLRHYLGRALEQVSKDAWDGGVWRFEVTGGRVVDGSGDGGRVVDGNMETGG